MKARTLVIRLLLLILVLILLVGSALVFAPRWIESVAPGLNRAVASQGAVYSVAWRLNVFARKLTGQIPEFSWQEVISGVVPQGAAGNRWPGSGFLIDKMYTRGLSLDAAVVNPMSGAEALAAGETIFAEQCAACHGSDGSGSAHGPSLKKAQFSVGNSDLSLYKTLRDGIPNTSMTARGLSIEERWQVIAYLRKLDPNAGGSGAEPVAIAPFDISWQDLLEPQAQPGRWLSYSGHPKGWRHSPLAQFTPDGVAGLRMLWALPLSGAGKGKVTSTPLAIDGTLYLTLPPSNVIAVDARSGNEIWRHTERFSTDLKICCGLVNRGVAVLGQTLFLATLDGRLVALEAASGKKRWETRVSRPEDGYTMTLAPLVVEDRIVVGVSGGDFGAPGFIAAFSAADGEKLWHFDAIPKPGAFGHDSWENEAWKTGGGGTWITGAHDAEAGLIYWGVGNPSPNFAGQARPGDNLFTNSVVALKADTGELAWHFQFSPHGTHDWDSNQSPVLTEMEIDGQRRKLILWANRNGFYYVLDRITGEFLHGTPFVKLNWASGLDKDGRPILTEANAPTAAGTLTEPFIGGGTNWPPPSYDPQRQLFIVHATEGASVFYKVEGKTVPRNKDGLYAGGTSSIARRPVNYLRALDPASGELKWEYQAPRQMPEPAHSYAGVLSTAGGVTFSGHSGYLFALNTETGEEVWRAGLGGDTQAAPISFELDGKQVLAAIGGQALFLFGL